MELEGLFTREATALVVVDLQEKLFPLVRNSKQVLDNCLKVIDFCRRLEIPILVTEQYPQGLGATLPTVKVALADEYRPIPKTAFSTFGEPEFVTAVEELEVENLALIGIETQRLRSANGPDRHGTGFRRAGAGRLRFIPRGTAARLALMRLRATRAPRSAPGKPSLLRDAGGGENRRPQSRLRFAEIMRTRIMKPFRTVGICLLAPRSGVVLRRTTTGRGLSRRVDGHPAAGFRRSRRIRRCWRPFGKKPTGCRSTAGREATLAGASEELRGLSDADRRQTTAATFCARII
jgi:hypothetical protein